MDSSCEVYGIVLFSKIGFIFSLIPLLFLTFNMQSFFESLKHIFKFRPKITQEKKYSFLLFYSFSILVFYSTKPKPQKLALCHDLNVHTCVFAQLLQSCPALCNSMGCSQTASSVHGILRATIPEWIAMPSSRGSSRFREDLLFLLHCRWIL